MTREFTEGALRFLFGDSWLVEQYDRHPDYRGRIEKLDKTKAVDFVGRLSGDLPAGVYLIEVKDYRPEPTAYKHSELALDVALKVRDTLAGILGAFRTSSSPETWRPFVEGLAQSEPPVRIVVWLEQPTHGRTTARTKNEAQVLAAELKKRCKWLTSQILVTNLALGSHPPKLSVKSLPLT